MDPRIRIIRRLEHDVAQLVIHKARDQTKNSLKNETAKLTNHDQKRQNKQTNRRKRPSGNIKKSEQNPSKIKYIENNITKG